jgi:lipoprotein NlpI
MLRTVVICSVTASVSLLGPMSKADESVDELLQRASALSQRGELDKAVEAWSAVIAKDPKSVQAYRFRGRDQFRRGKIEESLADFDKCVELRPEIERELWERGISHYYLGEFAKGAKQFELYQTFHDQDVENSVWRYLCVARQEGVEKAEANMLPIEQDRRVPMMEIYDLYRGQLKPEDVLSAAAAGEPLAARLNNQLFYAHLYIGLWHEAAGRPEEAKKHLLEAEQHKIGHYMWDVAHVYAERLRAAKSE